MRQAILLSLAFAMTALLLASTAAAEADRSSCPNGFTIHAVPQTEAQMRQLPRIAAGLDADTAPYTVAELVALGNLIDENQDGRFCLKDVSNLRGASADQWGFFYLARDNDTATG